MLRCCGNKGSHSAGAVWFVTQRLCVDRIQPINGEIGHALGGFRFVGHSFNSLSHVSVQGSPLLMTERANASAVRSLAISSAASWQRYPTGVDEEDVSVSNSSRRL
jgi:hypothetical protein